MLRVRAGVGWTHVNTLISDEDARLLQRAREFLQVEPAWEDVDDAPAGSQVAVNGGRAVCLMSRRAIEKTGLEPDPKCGVCRGSGRRPLDDAFGQDATLLTMTEETHADCYCVTGFWDTGERYVRS